MTYLKIPHDKRFCWCAFVERDLYANNFSVKHLALNQEEDCIWLQDCKLRLSQSWTWSLDQLSCLRFSMAHIDWPGQSTETLPHTDRHTDADAHMNHPTFYDTYGVNQAVTSVAVKPTQNC